MQQKFTRTEVVRMLGIRARQLDRWSKLGLIAPGRAAGVETYGFADLVALKTLKQLTEQGVPSRSCVKRWRLCHKKQARAQRHSLACGFPRSGEKSWSEERDELR